MQIQKKKKPALKLKKLLLKKLTDEPEAEPSAKLGYQNWKKIATMTAKPELDLVVQEVWQYVLLISVAIGYEYRC